MSHSGCEHGEDLFHSEGLCWKVTNPELENEPTNKKYCPCNSGKGLIRRYAKTGWMEVSPHDKMVAKKCADCGAEVLLSIEDKFCTTCKSQNR
tara:strand:+ start:395 stop:673 length:279 start_codon:yes stop_codon:yes gene_type:complete